MNAGCLYNATEVCQAELQDRARQEEVTLFDSSQHCDAIRDYELWLDQELVPRHEPRSQVEETLRQIANKHILEAEEALLAGDLQRAERLSGIAACADDRRLEPFAIQAAIDRSNGNAAGEQLMAELASTMAGFQAFERMVDYCFGIISRPKGSSMAQSFDSIPGGKARPMQDAARHPAAA